MSSKNSKISQVTYALLPSVVLLVIDLFTLYLQPQSYAISHLSLAVVTAQMLSLWLFLKADMCPGQRGRLINANKGLLLFWIVWLCVSGFSNYNYLITDLVSMCGIGMTVAIWLQPKKHQDRLPFIYMGLGIGIVAILVYLMMFMNTPLVFLPIFNPFAQLLVGTILLNLMLISARNRLHNFMALLPMTMLIALFINAVVIFGLLGYCYLNSVEFPNQIAWILYFAIHILLLVIIGAVLFFEKKLDYLILLILLILSASLTLWATFTYLHF
ncbi:hypothetical protein A6A19_04910 [Actinobacillus delphinicola]|uniref:hypothetical protein n=1 Tax=Actinobacillus delphinicola TaxID=51161 RepID=UPI00244119A0|nr:hypothetical protein [Actinobacillus delphinicola]MDG6897347.1 hypothetical protein [Actinobacillus delphinicola]